MLHADDGAGYGIGIMTVHAAELDGVAIQEHHVILNVDGTESDAVGDDFIRSIQQQGVQVRLLRIPESGILNREDCLMGVGTTIEGLNNACAHSLICWVQQLYLGGDKLAVASEPDADCSFLFVQQSGGEVIPNATFRALQDVDIPEDTGGAELVLVFGMSILRLTGRKYIGCTLPAVM